MGFFREFFQINERMLYLSHPEDSFDPSKTIDLLSAKPGNVEFGISKENKIQLGKYWFKQSPNVFFRFPVTDLIIDKDRTIQINFKESTYSVSIEELCNYISNYHQYSGYINVIEGYTHKEVAGMLGISEGTSKSQLFYSKKKLREILSR